jgi:hypothetical protein
VVGWGFEVLRWVLDSSNGNEEDFRLIGIIVLSCLNLNLDFKIFLSLFLPSLATAGHALLAPTFHRRAKFGHGLGYGTLGFR